MKVPAQPRDSNVSFPAVDDHRSPGGNPAGFAWDLLVILTSLASVIALPLLLLYPSLAGDSWPFWYLAPAAVFLADLVPWFRRLARRRNEPRPAGPAPRFPWFRTLVQILAAIPAGLVCHGPALAGAGTVWVIFSLLPLCKLVQVGGILQRRIGLGMNPAIFRLGTLALWILLAAHLIGCAWIGLADERLIADPVHEYVRALYWSITTVTTIGYGDITPRSTVQTIFTMFIQLFGAAVFSMIIANLASLVASIDGARTRHKEKLEKIGTFLSYKKIPRNLQKQVHDYFDYLWESRRGFDERSVLEELPEPLRVNIAMEINQDMIAKVPFFAHARTDLIREIVLHLQPVVYPPGQDIMREGELANDMFFISSGTVDVLAGPERQQVATLGEGAFFGEIALLFSTLRTATVRSRDYCDLYRLDRDTFTRILGGYPDFADYIKKAAEERRSRL